MAGQKKESDACHNSYAAQGRKQRHHGAMTDPYKSGPCSYGTEFSRRLFVGLCWHTGPSFATCLQGTAAYNSDKERLQCDSVDVEFALISLMLHAVSASQSWEPASSRRGLPRPWLFREDKTWQRVEMGAFIQDTTLYEDFPRCKGTWHTAGSIYACM